MATMKFWVSDLLEVLEGNRDKHRALFEEAVLKYRDTQVEELERSIEEIRAGKRLRREVVLPVPFDATPEYDRVIRMLVMTTDKELELDESRFGQLVMDEWNWKATFIASNSRYVDTSAVE